MILKVVIAELLIAGVLAGLGFYLSKKKGKIDDIELVVITITALLWAVSIFYTLFMDKLLYSRYISPGVVMPFSQSCVSYLCIFGGVLFSGVFIYLAIITVKHFRSPDKKYRSLFFLYPDKAATKRKVILLSVIFVAGFGVFMVAYPKAMKIDWATILLVVVVSLVSIALLKWRRNIRTERSQNRTERIPVTSWKKLSVAAVLSLVSLITRLNLYFVSNPGKYEQILNNLGVLQVVSISTLLTVATARLYRESKQAN